MSKINEIHESLELLSKELHSSLLEGKMYLSIAKIRERYSDILHNIHGLERVAIDEGHADAFAECTERRSPELLSAETLLRAADILKEGRSD